MENPNEQQGFSAEDRDIEETAVEEIPDTEADQIDMEINQIKEKEYGELF